MKHLYELLKSLEVKLLSQGHLDLDDTLELKKEFSKWEDSEEKWLLHLIKISKSLKENMSLQDLMIFIVPVERHLKKKITDIELLVNFEDRNEAVKENNLKVVFDNIRSAFNTGALFRTCEVLGVSEVILTGYTQGFESEQIVKTSMGARPNKTTRLRDLKEVKDYLKSYNLVALETSNQSEILYDMKLDKNTVFIVGNERFGLSEKSLALCDKIARLPTFGLKNSLNVNAALSACGYDWIRRFS